MNIHLFFVFLTFVAISIAGTVVWIAHELSMSNEKRQNVSATVPPPEKKTMTDETKVEGTLPPEHVTKLRAVVKELEDGLEVLDALPEHVSVWLKAKLSEMKSHL